MTLTLVPFCVLARLSVRHCFPVAWNEELACRGLGFRLLEAYGQRVAIVGSALAFALAHGAVIDLPWVLVTGLGLGYLRSRSGSIYPCVALHAIVNGVAVLASAALSAGANRSG